MKVLLFLEMLERQAARRGGRLHVLLGNHETINGVNTQFCHYITVHVHVTKPIFVALLHLTVCALQWMATSGTSSAGHSRSLLPGISTTSWGGSSSTSVACRFQAIITHVTTCNSQHIQPTAGFTRPLPTPTIPGTHPRHSVADVCCSQADLSPCGSFPTAMWS